MPCGSRDNENPMANKGARTCPHCGVEAKAIVYGLPTSETAERAKRGEFVLGGCVIRVGAPDYWCPGCGRTWAAPNLPREPTPTDDLRS